ncbi:hypothetical protein [Archangium sp.]|uniref:hypothetical protein n=1 Tax=Archangium sp. TaxID=1872627 RepID=UPI00286A4EBB|nr:hypothetical protein [Archangium sp.]
MADETKKDGSGLSTGAVIGIGVVCLFAGVAVTGVVYEMKVIPDALEAQKKGMPAGGLLGIQGGK